MKKLFFGSAFPRGSSGKHFVQNDAHCEYVGFVGVIISGEGLQRHVKWGTDVDSVFELEFSFDSKAKVSNFPLVADSQDVGWFEIAMNDPLVKKVLVSGEDLLHDLDGHALSDFLFLVDVIHQVSMGTILQNDVIMVGSFNDFVAFDDVFMAQGLVNLYFAFEHVEV